MEDLGCDASDRSVGPVSTFYQRPQLDLLDCCVDRGGMHYFSLMSGDV